MTDEPDTGPLILQGPGMLVTYLVTKGEYDQRREQFACSTEEDAQAAVAAGLGDDYTPLRVLPPGMEAPVVRYWWGYLAAFSSNGVRSGDPVIHEETCYAWDSPGRLDDQSQDPRVTVQRVSGTDRAAVVAALEAWAERRRTPAPAGDQVVQLGQP